MLAQNTLCIIYIPSAYSLLYRVSNSPDYKCEQRRHTDSTMHSILQISPATVSFANRQTIKSPPKIRIAVIKSRFIRAVYTNFLIDFLLTAMLNTILTAKSIKESINAKSNLLFKTKNISPQKLWRLWQAPLYMTA